ncbi:MAG TPA: ABC transporter ATP-binding protein [Deltaproteobacteria bacterium]|nr:ABC transporter ATP-binding protein [Deltaproteobacteria bacterium]
MNIYHDVMRGEVRTVPRKGQFLLEIHDLHTQFTTPEGIVKAVDGVDLALRTGSTLGIVGESGCGKTVLALSILRLIPDPPGRITRGRIVFQGMDLLGLDDENMRSIRGNKISMIFQEPMTSLNPVFTIGSQIAEVILLHQRERAGNRREALAAVVDMLGLVGISRPEKRIHDYPHQLSGGMCQRVMIAMAMACKPALLIADEPTTALDVTTQAQILRLMDGLKTEIGTSVILVTHDLGIVAQVCQDVAVMYTGHVVEYSPARELFSDPLHPYTKGLMRSVPRLSAGFKGERLHAIPGTVPTFRDMPQGCTFHPRCPEVMDICRMEYPGVFHPSSGRKVRCWRYARS